ncbi:MAG TPA: hypothetical protein VIO58_13645 [Candidatus Methanoperedens sp.]
MRICFRTKRREVCAEFPYRQPARNKRLLRRHASTHVRSALPAHYPSPLPASLRFRFNLLNARQAGPQVPRQGAGQFIPGYLNGFMYVPQGIPGKYPVTGLAQYQPDGSVIDRVPEEIINSGTVEIDLLMREKITI